ncbi:hypothetical protein BOX15_Mlig032797g1, partial [Macrostomum lignano]
TLIFKKRSQTMIEEHSFGPVPITCHSFNKDCSQLALSLNSNTVDIYKKSGQKWEKLQSLEEHSERVTSIDWAANTDRIVTASADRNAHVWTRDSTGQFRPTLVLLRIDRAATVVKWSPLENKFAVGSGAKLVSVCHFEPEHNWWVCKQIKKPFKSTVTCLAWHPNNCLLAVGATDFKARIVSAYLKEADEKPAATCWGGNMKFSNVMAEYTNGGSGWIRDVAFNGDGSLMAWVSHDSSVSVANGSTQTLAVLRFAMLPMLTCCWLSDTALVAAGHDCYPVVFRYEAGSASLSIAGQLNMSADQSGGSTKMTAKTMFGNMDRMATEDSVEKLTTVHQNSINQLAVIVSDASRVRRFSTVGVDGRLVVWDTDTIEQKVANLRI